MRPLFALLACFVLLLATACQPKPVPPPPDPGPPPSSVKEPLAAAGKELGKVPASLEKVNTAAEKAEKKAPQTKPEMDEVRAGTGEVKVATDNTAAQLREANERADKAEAWGKAQAKVAEYWKDKAEGLQKQVDWNDRYGDRLFNLSCLMFALGAACVVGIGLSFYPQFALVLAPFRVWGIGGAALFLMSGVFGMQYLEHHDDIWEVVKWTLLISIPVAVAGLAVYAGIRLSHEKKQRAAEGEEADVRQNILDIVLGKLKAASDTNGDGKIDRADLIDDLYKKTPSKWHHVIEEVVNTVGLSK